MQLIDPSTTPPSSSPTSARCRSTRRTTISVDVARVPCEMNIANNSAQYKVLFTLPSLAAHAPLRERRRPRRRSRDRARRGRARRRAARLDARSPPPRRAADARRRRPQGPRRVRRLAAGRGSTTSTARSTRSRRGLARVDRRVDESVANTRDRPLRRLRGHGRPPVGVARAARRGADGHRRSRRSRAATTPGST